MKSEDEMRKVAAYCEKVITTKLQSMHPLQDFYLGVQRGLSWALGDIDEAWTDMEAEIESDIHPYQFALEQVRKAIEGKSQRSEGNAGRRKKQ